MKLPRWLHLPAKFAAPVITDRTVDLMAAGYWLAYALWGVFTLIYGLPTIQNGSGVFYQYFWGFGIGITAIGALTAVLTTFMDSSNIKLRINKKLTEFISVSVLAGFISVYPALAFTAVVSGDHSRFSTLFIALSFLLFPTWRVRHLYHRITALREKEEAAKRAATRELEVVA